MIEPVGPAIDEARELIRELDAKIAALYPGLPINGIDVAEFEQAGGYFVIARAWPTQLASDRTLAASATSSDRSVGRLRCVPASWREGRPLAHRRLPRVFA